MPSEDAASDEDPALSAARLERALERIAAIAHRPQPGVPGPATIADAELVASKLDTMIARIRAALEQGED